MTTGSDRIRPNDPYPVNLSDLRQPREELLLTKMGWKCPSQLVHGVASPLVTHGGGQTGLHVYSACSVFWWWQTFCVTADKDRERSGTPRSEERGAAAASLYIDRRDTAAELFTHGVNHHQFTAARQPVGRPDDDNYFTPKLPKLVACRTQRTKRTAIGHTRASTEALDSYNHN